MAERHAFQACALLCPFEEHIHNQDSLAVRLKHFQGRPERPDPERVELSRDAQGRLLLCENRFVELLGFRGAGLSYPIAVPETSRPTIHEHKTTEGRMTPESDLRRVFVSYSSRDRGFVTSLCEHLALLGVPIWFDRLEMSTPDGAQGPEELQAVLHEALRACSALLVVLDRHAASSSWVDYEIKTAMYFQRSGHDLQILGIVTELDDSFDAGALLKDASILDFSSGYKTALGKLGRLLGSEMSQTSVVSVGLSIAAATRDLSSGLEFSAHLESLGLPLGRVSWLESARSRLSRFDEAPATASMGQLAESLQNETNAEATVLDRISLPTSEGNRAYSMGISFLPTLPVRQDITRGVPDIVRALLVSIWPASEKVTPANMTTLVGEYNPDESSYLWMCHASRIHRYTMGSSQCPSILLSEDRNMGDRESAHLFPHHERSEDATYYRQAYANKLGLGTVQQGQEVREPDVVGVRGFTAWTLWNMIKSLGTEAPPILTEPRGMTAYIWDRVVGEGWQRPELSQASALLAHLSMGGLLLYEQSARSPVSPLLAVQINQLVEAAEGRVFEIESATTDSSWQYICASPRIATRVVDCLENQ